MPNDLYGDTTDEQLEQLKDILRLREASHNPKRPVNQVFVDTTGHPTVGVGHKVVPSDRLRVGDWIDDARREQLLHDDASKALAAARTQVTTARIADPSFAPSLGSVNFQLGDHWTKDFPKTWQLIQDGDYDGAADEAARSRWNAQSPVRVTDFQSALRRLGSRGE